MNELRYRDLVGHPSIVNIHLSSPNGKHSNLDAWVDVSDKRTSDSIYKNKFQVEAEHFLVDYIDSRT